MLLGYYSFHFIIPSLPLFSFLSILLVHIYFMKKGSLFWTSLLKTLHKFYNCIRKGFFEVTILNQVITMQIMNFYFIGNGQGKNSLLTKHHFILLNLPGKLYFRKAMVSLFLTSTEGKDYLLFTGAWHFVVQS